MQIAENGHLRAEKGKTMFRIISSSITFMPEEKKQVDSDQRYHSRHFKDTAALASHFSIPPGGRNRTSFTK